STIEKSDLHRGATTTTTTTTTTSFNATILSDTTINSYCKSKTNLLTTVTHTRPSIITSINTTGSLNETSDYNIQLINRGSAINNSSNIVHIDSFYSTTSLPNIPGISYQTTEDQSFYTNPGQVTQNTSIFNSSLFNSNTNITYYLIALMMVDNDNGLPFISATTTDAFPNYTFISIDAVNWIIKWFPDITTIEQAIFYLQQMLEAGWICHTSGNSKHVFIYGTYFYTLLIPDIKQLTNTQIDTSLNLSTLDNSEMNIQSAPVTPIQLNIPNTNCTSSPSSNTSQSISGLSSSSVFPLTTTTLTTTSLSTSNNLIISYYLPKLLNDTTKWTSVFQNEWAEISIVHYGSNEYQMKQQQQHHHHQQQHQRQQILDSKYMNSNIHTNDTLNEMNDTSTISSSSFFTPTITTPTATTTTTTTTIPITTNNSCPSLSTSEIKFEHVNELNSFFNDGLLTYSSISTLFGIPDKTGFQVGPSTLAEVQMANLKRGRAAGSDG
ncbi:unnamed protein product, partial [Schistosoma curassoni]|uniref:DEP domain-containing protein n=1 Tax=Schistosoma curassoni TaxID=6186 RepID=A0A183KL73_9TREM